MPSTDGSRWKRALELVGAGTLSFLSYPKDALKGLSIRVTRVLSEPTKLELRRFQSCMADIGLYSPPWEPEGSEILIPAKLRTPLWQPTWTHSWRATGCHIWSCWSPCRIDLTNPDHAEGDIPGFPPFVWVIFQLNL